MKLSKKYKQKIKKRILNTLASIALVTTTLAAIKLADFSMPLNKELITSNENYQEKIANGPRLENTETTTYIYDAQDLVAFRNEVNAGDSYIGKTVYLMADIDMSSVCSETVGSWKPIGTYVNDAGNTVWFSGIFEGNYHTISNLYASSSEHLYLGLFTVIKTTATIQNVNMKNVYVYNTYNNGNNYAAAIAGANNGIIQNCSINGGSISNKHTKIGTSTSVNVSGVGGITGANNLGTIRNSYNNATVLATSNTSSSYANARAGGIAGHSTGAGNIINCYNKAKIEAKGYTFSAGGIVGSNFGDATVKNCYNYGTVTGTGNGTKYIGGIVGRNAAGYTGEITTGTISNSYCTTGTTYSYYYYSGGYKTSTTGRVAANTLKTYTVTLGSSFAYDVYNKNSGYPVLAWENETPVMRLNKNQEYIKVGENLQLNMVQSDEITEIIGTNYQNSNFKWTSTNEDVATVNANGVVTGISDGYTTVYAYHETSKLYAMAIINVAKDFTNPQIETGNRFTAILKSDGTVWTIGNNANGQLGNGTTESSNTAVQVHMDEDTPLSNIVKISVGSDHVLGLTNDGKVYAWGKNEKGQLGQNNTTNLNYAKLVLSENGNNYLSNIIDISAGSYSSIALDKNGNVYVWGDGSNGQIGNNTTNSSNLPVKTSIKNAIRVAIGVGHASALTSDGILWSWGRNVNGQQGINCTTNTSYPMKTALNVTELGLGGYHTTFQKVDGTVYAAGPNTYGRLATTLTTTTSVYTKMTLPTTVTATNKVKYIKGGIINTTIVLTDGSVWETGFNLQGELGNGTTTTATSFVRGSTEKGKFENVLTVGRNLGDVGGSLTTGYGLNTAVITKDGNIYTTGDNTYGQLGNNQDGNSLYYTKMGNIYLDYQDKYIELTDEDEYQIDLNKLKYFDSSINAYNNKEVSGLGELKYISSNPTIATIDENGKITPKVKASGTTKITIQDTTNNYETYLTIAVNKLENTDKITYIYSTEDMVKFRDTVNAGYSYAGKTVYLMSDIDLSTVCSETLGSWKPIGTYINSEGKAVYFAGTFDGNYHKISNLYINTNKYRYAGLFTFNQKSTIIQNLMMENVNINNTYNSAHSQTGGILAVNYGTILNCATISGSIKASETIIGTSRNSMICSAGGIVSNNLGIIDSCYNGANVHVTSNAKSSYGQARAGGIAGYASSKETKNCYNTGNISTSGYYVSTGGVVAVIYDKGKVKNCYNYGAITSSGARYSYSGGVIGRNGAGYTGSITSGTLSNSYCTTDSSSIAYYIFESETKQYTGRIAADTLKTYKTKLGQAFENDDYNINKGYPILWWQVPTIGLNKKHEYIKAGEKIQLSIIQNEDVITAFGTQEIDISNFEWISTNEEVATVNENGLITGISEGYTTIYGYNSANDIYTMCVINVYEEKANPQIETGEGFTAILKADGTVWTIGKNENGELGDGTNEERIEAAQVKINENTYLTDIVKISVGTNHVLALTKDGKVYAWGANKYGQLGQNNTENLNYAKLVLGEHGNSVLDRIIDISAGSYGSIAINDFGWVYVWGNGTYGEIGNNNTSSKYVPTKNSLNTGIASSMGAGHIALLGQNGIAYTWGRNSYGELGIGNTTNATTVTKALEGVVEISAAGFETLVKKVDGKVYAAGLNTSGQLANGTVTNKTSFTAMTLPNTVTDTNKVKYIKAGRTSSTVMLTDGTVYTVGANINGELGNKTNTNSSSFVQAQTRDGVLENTVAIGRSSGETTSLDNVTINKNGRVYTSGSNTYGQIGNNTKDNTNYFSVMGYIEVIYPEKIIMNVNDTKILTGDDFAYVEKYMNVYQEDITKVPLVADGKIIDENIATYEDGTITARNFGRTMLIAKEETTGTLIYIPVVVLPENAEVMPDVKTGNNYTITLKSNGTVWSFGTNTYGELGVGDNTYRNVPEQVEVLKDKVVEQISVGNSHVIALTQDGKVYTWGLNTKGQLGLGTTKNSNIPQQVVMPEGTEIVQVIEDTVIKVIANKNTSFAITQSGKVYCWGEGYGLTPTLLENTNDIIDISSSYALDIDGNVYDLETNTRLEIVEKIKYISEGETHTIFLSENRTGYAIGSNTFGQFGDGTNVSNETEVVAIRNEDLTDILRNIEKIEAGSGYTVALLESGEIVEFGSNQYGQLGTDEVNETNTIRVNTSVARLLSELNKNIILMDAGKGHVAITLSDGNVYTWGEGKAGQLGNGINEAKIDPQLVGKNIIEVNTNNLLLSKNETFELQANTTYFNLIQDINGEISYESKDESIITVDRVTGSAVAVAEGTTVIVAKENGTENISVIQVRVLPEGIKIEPQVKTNGSHTVTLKSNGTVWSYGNNKNGELGNGKTSYSDEPVQAIFPEGTIIVQVDAGENFSVALDSEGNVWTWGANDYYQLGNSSMTYTATPTKVAGLSNITKISAGTYSVLAINNNKEVYGFGLNSNGELGIGSYTNKVVTPTKAKYMTDVIDIAVGKNHSIALKSTGEVFVTGLNIYGQIGNNDTETKKVNQFTKVENLSAVARISATDSGNLVSNINGKVYTWGLNIYGELGLGDKVNRYEPTLVNGIENAVLVSGGKNHSAILEKSGKVYTAGSNKYGYLGNGTNVESLGYTEVPNLSNVMTISAGNTYTALAKEDGSVWGFGDYNHGDRTLKSKTSSSVPVQVGNDSFGLGITEVTIKKSETVSITSNMVYSFNLIHLSQNNTEKLTYESLNEEIAIVNEYGEVLGVREGFTWVKVIEEDGTEHVVYVYVTDNEANYSPRVSAGEDFASVLKSDGSIWTFGHNNNGELGIGSNRTKDIPEKTNVISSYKQISSGESFTIAIREDGTVWSYGKNNYGQLGIGNTRNGLNPVQVNGITDIVQIAAGKEHSVAIDSYGILYGWGRNIEGQLGVSNETVLTPVPISYTGGTVSSIWAGDNQTIIINTKGEIFGFGSILNGKLEGISNGVKVSVGNGYMLILTTDGNVYKYNGNSLNKYTELAQIVDIDVTNSNNIAQTSDEKVYTWINGELPVLEDIENIYKVASGENNSYVILTDGTVYAKGENQYGQLGNSTRENSLTEFTLVGDRSFTIEPESKIMYVNDVENLAEQIIINEFNVFNKEIRNAEEYNWKSSDENIVTANDGELKAIADGTAKITVTDNVTNAEVTVTRVVIPVEKDRIETISVNEYKAKIADEYKYYVEVETNENTGTISIKTKDKTDKISIDGGQTWYENGTLTSEINIPGEETLVSILVETTNGTQIPYTLTIKKISTDVSLESIIVDGITATAISSTNYEVVVSEDTDLSEIIAIANSNEATVSINGEEFILKQAETEVEFARNLQITLPIIVQAENKDELEYSLTIYKESEVLKLQSLTVDGKETVKTSETIYSTTIARDLSEVEVTAKAVSELVKVSLNSENSEIQISTKEIDISDEITQVSIRLSTMVDGEEVYRDYTLNIYKKLESGKIQFVIVNGTVVLPELDGTYEIYLPEETQNAEVKVIAENELDYVQIESNEKEQGTSQVQVTTPEDSNEYQIIISDEDLTSSVRYKLYIKKPSVDNSIKQITVSNGDDIVTAKKSTEEENVYIAKVKSYDEYKVQVTTNNIYTLVSIDGEEAVKNIASKVITRTDEYMEVEITVEAENGDIKDFLLKIYVMNNDVTLEYVKVNDLVAKLQADGSYLVNLVTPETEVTIKAQATSDTASVKIEDEKYKLHTIEKDITIDSKETVKYIEVKAEDGTTSRYKLVITGLPDDTTLKKVLVNDIEAKYIEGENKYEIRLDSQEFNVKAIATDSFAKVSLNGEEETVETAITTVTKEEGTTVVKIEVIAQNGINTENYVLEIKEKSSDSSISKVTVNGKLATKTLHGNYEAEVVNSVKSAVIQVEANDSYATVYLDDETKNTNNITVTKEIEGRETIYTIKVVAEDGTEETHTLNVTRLEANVNIQELTVTVEVEEIIETEDEETGEILEEKTLVKKEYTPELQPDGSYYLKIDRVENADVIVILEDPNAEVKIKNSEYMITHNIVTVDTVTEITKVPISVKAEDGTIKEYILVLEKKSNDTTIKEILSDEILEQEDYTIYVDESVTEMDLTLVTNSTFASIKLESEEEYTPKKITRTIDLSDDAKIEDENVSGWLVKLDVLAEDGTVGKHTITIVKTGNANIDFVKVNEEIIKPEDATYTARVNVADTAKVEIKPQNAGAKVEIIERVIAEDETVTETVIFTATGTLTANVPLKENPQNYIIRVTSANGSTINDYSLVLEKKSTDVSISYVKVDNITTIETEQGYKSVVSGKEKYPVVIKTTDENAQIKIAYNNYVGKYSKGKLEESVPVLDGETLEVTITVLSENGDEKEYKLYITRISNNTELEYIKVNGETVTNFNKDKNTYSIQVDNDLTLAEIEVKTISDTSKITIASANNTGLLTTTSSLDGPGTIKTVTIKVDAEDGTTKYYYLEIVQLSETVSVDEITVNDIKATKINATNYEVTISNKTGFANVKVTSQDELSTIAIAEDVASKVQATKTFTINGVQTIKTTFVITAEDGKTSQEYNLTIYVLDSNTKLEYVKVDEAEVTEYDANTNTYKITVDNTLENSNIEIKTISDTSQITIGDETKLNVLSKEVALNGAGKTTLVTFIVTAEDGSTQKYTLEIYQLSNDAKLDNITVNGETAVLNNESGNYEIEIDDSVDVAKIVATAVADTSKVSIAGETANLKTATKTREITGHEVIEMVITITAEDGTVEEYNLEITVLETSNSVSYVKVNTGTIEPEDDKVTYKTFIDYNSTKADIEIKPDSIYADIDITNAEDLNISNEALDSGVFSFTVDTPENVTEITYTVTSEVGETKSYSIILTKIATDNTLKELYVDDTLIQADEDGNYYFDIENSKEVTVKAVANNEYANIRIDYNAEQKQQTQATVNAEKLVTEVTITITSQAGVTTRYYLYIRVLANNTMLDKVLIDSTEITDYEEKTKTYTALVDNTKDSYEIFLMAINDNATVELFDGEELISSGVGSITDILNLESNEEGHSYRIKVSLDEGNYSNYTLNIIRTSNDTSLKLVEVNDVVRSPKEDDIYVYEVGIPKLAETAKIRVKTNNSYATVKIGDFETVREEGVVNISINLEEGRTTVPVVVTAVDGTTIDTFNILLIRQSNSVEIGSVVVNDNEVENENDVYTYYMASNENIANTEITMPIENNALIEVDEYEGIGYLEFTETFGDGIIKIEKTIKVTSEDGTKVKEYKLVLIKQTKIKGTIITENFEGKHISEITLYKDGQEEAVAQIQTKEEGTYEIDLTETGVYKVVVSKLGYLNYTVENIEIDSGSIIELDEYKLLAGDINNTGEIEIFDLVGLNEKCGITVSHEDGVDDENVVYDLNEDGIVNSLDRNILKANYGKLAERLNLTIYEETTSFMLERNVEETKDEEENKETEDNKTLEETKIDESVVSDVQDFILPMNCDYTITSEYGMRVHPTTGEYKKHTGIDIKGKHHTEILAVADGEVTFAGVKNGFGNCVEIKHIVNGVTIYSFYAHLSRIDVQVGDTVEQGNVIGLEGGDPETDPNPGSSTGHHLHFEIRTASGSRNDVNPNDYIKF